MSRSYAHPLVAIPLIAAETSSQTWSEVADIASVPDGLWLALCDRAIDPNPFYDPAWVRAALSGARVDANVKFLLAWQGEGRQRLIGLLPVVSAWQAMRLPLPILVAWQGYGPLTIPLIDRHFAPDAWRGLRAAALAHGARALRLPFTPMHSDTLNLLDPSGAASENALGRFERAKFDASQSIDAVAAELALHRTLRRQRRKLEAHGAIRLIVARTPQEVAPALETFLNLERQGWKGESGTALAMHAGDAAFIRAAGRAMAGREGFEVLTLWSGERAVASALIVRQRGFASWFKIGIDWSFARYSPGKLLALEVARHYAADLSIESVDSNSETGVSLVDALWPQRYAIGDLLLPLRPADAVLPALRAVLAVSEAVRAQARRLLTRSSRG